MGSDAANSATAAQTNAANQQTQLERDIFETQYNDPYLVSTKNLAISAQNALAPLAGLAPPQTSGGPAQGATPLGGGGPDFAAYLQANPDVARDFQRQMATPKGAQLLAREGVRSAEDFAALHYQRYGQAEGRQLPTKGGAGGNALAEPPPAAAPATPAPTPAEGASTISNALQANPAYEFVRNEGEKGVNAQLGLRGLTDSGARAKAIARYNQDYAGTRLDEERAFLSSLATGGQYATSMQGNALQGYGSGAGSAIRAGGNALAEGAYASAQPWAGAVGEIGTRIGGGIDDWLRRRKKTNALAPAT